MKRYLQSMDTILSELFTQYKGIVTTPGVLLSGGIDSSTVTHLISRYFDRYIILSMGASHTKDREYIDTMSVYLEHDYLWKEITEDEIRKNYGTVVNILNDAGISRNLMQVSLAMGYFLIFKMARDAGITHIFTGQGPDVLFAGYNKYKSAISINEQIQNDLPLLDIDKKRDASVAAYFNLTLINPYLEDVFVKFAMTVPADMKLKGGIEKAILRKYAADKGLPEAIYTRPKKAFQYSTGIQAIIKKIYYNN